MFRFFFFIFFAHFRWACGSTFLKFYFAHQNCLFNNSFISQCISMKLIPKFNLCLLYKPTNLQLHTTKCNWIRMRFTLCVGRCHNLCSLQMNWIKLYTHKLHIYLNLWEKFKENMTTSFSRTGLSNKPSYSLDTCRLIAVSISVTDLRGLRGL